MTFNPNKHHRKSIRLKGFDYCQAGWYYITLVTNNRQSIFGEVHDGVMVLNTFGKIVQNEWLKTAQIRENITLDEYIIMPNHLHGIIHIIGKSDSKGTTRCTPTEQYVKPVPGSIPTIIRSFKSAVTKNINQLNGTPGLSVWQRNYWERVIRDEPELNRIRQYILENPLKWMDDKNYKG